MSSPIWLIAEREFRTYVATLSFWAALAVGPLAAGGGLLLAQGAHQPAQPVAVAVASADASLARAAEAALKEAGSLDGRDFAFTDTGARLTITAPAPDVIDLSFEPDFPLSAAGRALVARTLERDAARRNSDAASLTVHQVVSHSVLPPRRGPADVARFVLMAMLWLTLTGSLGMLLQTVVRERATRSLESLLAAASPWQIMTGKLAGVWGVSLLVLAAWIGSSGALALFVPEAGLAPAVLAELMRPGLLLRAAVIYCLAYGFYGSVTVAIGAMARDSASAQNLSRPMFILLMAAFFIALALALGNSSAPWLIFLPPLTPFLLLVYPADALSWSTQLGLFGLMAAATFLVARFAASRFGLREGGAGFFDAKTAGG
ncbi:MAG: ABC transporter permease [Pseudomonadota bacterium]